MTVGRAISMCDRCGLLWFFFFFQAEDGIRDVAVTGVQTCALPICFDALPLRTKLLRHLERNFTAKAIPTEHIRPRWLQCAQVSNIPGSHVLDCSKLFNPFQSAGMETIDGLLIPEMASEIGVSPKHSTASAMHEEERRPGTMRLNCAE